MSETSKVNAAIVGVMSGIKKLGKTDRNNHSGYNFVSVDDFMEAVRPLCVEHGLFITQDEKDFDVIQVPGKSGDKAWLRMRFSYTVCHVSGEQIGPFDRTIMVDAMMGSQAFGSAQSYSLKQFMRSMFQVATGEEEVDHKPQSELPKQAPRFSGKPAALGGDPDPKLAEAVDLRDRISAAIKAGTLSPDAVKRIHDQHGNPVPTDPDAYLAFGVAVVESMNGGV